MPTHVEIPFSADAKRVLAIAADEADAFGHGRIGTEHLLLAILREEGSAAATVLATHGVRLGTLQEKARLAEREH